MTFTKNDLRRGYRGLLYKGRDFVGGIYLKNGRAFVLDVEYGQVRRVIAEHNLSDFRVTGTLRVSATQWETHYELKI